MKRGLLTQKLHNNRGSALIMSTIIAFVFLSSIVWFSSMEWNHSHVQQSALASQKAYEYADSGLSSTRPWLKSPDASTKLPAGPTSSYPRSFDMPNGRCDVILYRTSPDKSLVDAYATGYYFLPRGTVTDPVTGKPAQMAVLHAIMRVTNLAEFLVATPGDLSIGYGTNAADGIVYAQNLTFKPGAGLPTTQVGQALYTQSIVPNPPAFVVFTSTPNAPQKLAYAPAFATLDKTTRDYYKAIKTVVTTPDFSGDVSDAGDSSVYYVDNGSALEVAANGPLTIHGVWVVYTTGNINIHNNIVAADANSWAAFLSEGDIHISEDAPPALTLTGNFVCNGTLSANSVTPAKMPGTIDFTGGLVTMSGIDVSTTYGGNRTYTYHYTPDRRLILPNVSDTMQRSVIAGSSSYK